MPSYAVETTRYRWRALGRFVVVYRIDAEASVVTLMRLFHMSQDWRGRLLRGEGE